MMARGRSRKPASVPRRSLDSSQTIRTIYRELSLAWGPQHWWPAEDTFEVIVGAILTQNTSWTNVERALANLRSAKALSVDGIRSLPLSELEQLVRPSGYFRQKAARLKDFVAFVDQRYGGSLEAMLARPTARLRGELLAQKGIGPETADSILLYAGQHPIFVVDAYTRRVLERHEAVTSNAKYDDVREVVEKALQLEQAIAPTAAVNPAIAPQAHPPSAMSTTTRPALAQVYNEMHGLFVQLGKHYCTKRHPRCEECPLSSILGAPRMQELPTATQAAKRPKSQKPAKPRL